MSSLPSFIKIHLSDGGQVGFEEHPGYRDLMSASLKGRSKAFFTAEAQKKTGFQILNAVNEKLKKKSFKLIKNWVRASAGITPFKVY